MAKWQVILCALPLLAGSPAAAFAQSTDTEVKPNAEDLANQAYEAYKKGDYGQALAQYQRAFQISAAAPLLFNIAQIYDRKLHERDLASEYYRRYLRLPDADPELIKRANERLVALKREEEALRDNPPPPAGQPQNAARTGTQGAPPPASPDHAANGGAMLRTAGIAAAGLGVVGLAVGTIFGLSAKSKNDDAASQCPSNACPSQQGVSLTDDARHAATISSVGFIAGGILVAGGLTLYFAAPKDQKTAFRVAPSVGLNSAGLTLGRDWQ